MLGLSYPQGRRSQICSAVTEGSRGYVTIAPLAGFCEVELDGADSLLVKAVGQCLRAPADRLRALFNTAFRTVFSTECVMTRTTTSLVVRGGKGRKSSVRYFALDSDEAGFMTGMEAMVLLMARRSESGPTTTLRLGSKTPLGDEYPVSIEVSLPLCPSRLLFEMVSNTIPLSSYGRHRQYLTAQQRCLPRCPRAGCSTT